MKKSKKFNLALVGIGVALAVFAVSFAVFMHASSTSMFISSAVGGAVGVIGVAVSWAILLEARVYDTLVPRNISNPVQRLNTHGALLALSIAAVAWGCGILVRGPSHINGYTVGAVVAILGALCTLSNVSDFITMSGIISDRLSESDEQQCQVD